MEIRGSPVRLADSVGLSVRACPYSRSALSGISEQGMATRFETYLVPPLSFCTFGSLRHGGANLSGPPLLLHPAYSECFGRAVWRIGGSLGPSTYETGAHRDLRKLPFYPDELKWQSTQQKFTLPAKIKINTKRPFWTMLYLFWVWN